MQRWIVAALAHLAASMDANVAPTWDWNIALAAGQTKDKFISGHQAGVDLGVPDEAFTLCERQAVSWLSNIEQSWRQLWETKVA